MKRPHSGHEKIATAFRLDETWQAMHPLAQRVILDDHHACSIIVRRQRVLVATKPSEIGIVKPGLLNKFKLPLNIGIDGHEQYALRGYLSILRFLKWTAAAHQAMTF